MEIDELDTRILSVLVREGRVRWSALAEKFGISSPAIADRVRRLEAAGIITGYTAQISAEALGIDLTAFVFVTLEHPKFRQGFIAYVQTSNCVQSCHHVVGEGDFLLKVRCRSTAHLEQVLTDEIKSIPGIAQTRTTISLSTVKESQVLPMEVR
ncbi:MAG: Lrp/AsnC family transcriptional regulator [Cyanobacteria bacterium P01_D01_bin.105]